MQGSYFRLLILSVSSEEQEVVSAFCWQWGALGISEQLGMNPEVHSHDLSVYFDLRPDKDFFLGFQQKFPLLEIAEAIEPHRDWQQEWKKGYTSFPLAGPYWVVPSWLDIPEAAEIPLRIDPGMAFGTGTHATTQMAAQLLIDLMDDQTMNDSINQVQSRSVLDVGTGTGVLAMMAKMQGAQRVLALDIDEEAIRTTQENLQANNLTGVEVSSMGLRHIDEQFDIVIANIIELVLMALRGDLIRVLRPGGRLILSGILKEDEHSFLETFLRDLSIKPLAHRFQDEWVAFLIG